MLNVINIKLERLKEKKEGGVTQSNKKTALASTFRPEENKQLRSSLGLRE